MSMNRKHPTENPPTHLPIKQPGTEWTPNEIELAKDWFANSHLKQACAIAFLELKTRGFPRFDLAEDAVSEWIAGKVDSNQGLLPPRFNRAVFMYDPTKGQFLSFLFKDLKLYISGTFSRRLVSELRLIPIDEIEVIGTKNSHSFNVTFRDLIRLVFESLDEKERRILRLCCSGYSTSEIAELCQTTNSAVKTAICRARSHARDAIDQLTN